MKLGLGIDTGGTCTDAVLFDMEAQQIIGSAKAPTTREDLTVGILGALDALPVEQLRQVTTVSLSTTLATNACVEDKGGRARLILIGAHRKVVSTVGREYGLPDAGEITFVDGGCDRFGQISQPIDFDEVMAEVEGWIGSVDAVAVVEYNGVANPVNERTLRDRIGERYALPVVCGHELFNEYNVLGRAASALLNARLIVVIRAFLEAIGNALDARALSAQKVIVRSDGTLMQSGFAKVRPVETILCGPAASVLGGAFLTGERDALLIDMGGTTTDIAVIKDGSPIPTATGVQIGAWRTFVQSVQIDTVGLGGDSIITRDRMGGLVVGPRRAMPLSFAATRWPCIGSELQQLSDSEAVSTHPLNEYLTLVKDISGDPFYTEQEQALCRLLKERPLTVDRAATLLGTDYYRFRFDRLEENGVILRAALTVTDIMHVLGDFVMFDRTAAENGAAFLARCLSLSTDRLCGLCYERVKQALYRQCIHLLLRIEQPELFGKGIGEQLDDMIAESWRLFRAGETFFRFPFVTRAACVGLGAPTHIFLPDVAKALGTVCVTPEHAAVANAIGAIVASVEAQVSIEIKPVLSAGGIDGYAVLGPETCTYGELEDAIAAARETARAEAIREARRRGVTGEVTVSFREKSSTARLGKGGEEDETLFLGMLVTASAAGSL